MAQVKGSPDEALSVVEFQPNKLDLFEYYAEVLTNKTITELHISQVSLS